MKVWLITVIVIFAAMELWSWVQKFTLPLPLYLMAGALLAIASNLEKVPWFKLPAAEQSNHSEP